MNNNETTANIENNIQESQNRQVNLQLEYINYQAEDILENRVQSYRKRPKTNSPTDQMPRKTTMENDGIFIDGLDDSVGTYIKNQAKSRYSNFSSLPTNDQTITSLGMNSILDLSYEYGEGQSVIFSKTQWDSLCEKFKKPTDDTDDDVDIAQLTQTFSHAHKQLTKTKNSITTKYTKLTTQLENGEKIFKSEDEKFFLFLINHIIDVHKNYQYLFDNNINCSEWDFLLKIWSPIIETLFKVSKIRTKWGDTICQITNDNGGIELKIDLRILLDKQIQGHNVEYDLASGEFAKYDPGLLKYQSDRCKLMVEAKTIIDRLIASGIELDCIPILQICGTELMVLDNTLVAPALYVGDEIYSGSLINTFDDLKNIPELALALIKFRNRCFEIQEFIHNDLTVQQQAKKSIKGPKYQKNAKKIKPYIKSTWTRRNWIVFRDKKYNADNIPPPPFMSTIASEE